MTGYKRLSQVEIAGLIKTTRVLREKSQGRCLREKSPTLKMFLFALHLTVFKLLTTTYELYFLHYIEFSFLKH